MITGPRLFHHADSTRQTDAADATAELEDPRTAV